MLMTTAGLLKSSVYPSGADLATYSFAILVPAPGRFSTIACWPRSSESLDASSRALMSTPPPGLNPTTSRSGRLGKGCARAAAPCAASASASSHAKPGFPCMSRFFSIRLQVRLLHDRAVSIVLLPEELGELLRRVARRLQAQGEKALLDVASLEDLADLARQPPGNRARHSRGRHEADPAGHLVARQLARLGDRRQVRDGAGAPRGRHGQGPEAPALHEGDHGGHGF